MITVKILDLVNGAEALQKLANAPLKAKLAWQVAKLLQAAEKEIQDFNTTRMQLINKYGEKDDKGELVTDSDGNCKIIADSTTAFNAELSELLANEVEINGSKLKINDLESIDFTPSEISALEPLIEFEE